jgi:hypothetical protein
MARMSEQCSARRGTIHYPLHLPEQYSHHSNSCMTINYNGYNPTVPFHDIKETPTNWSQGIPLSPKWRQHLPQHLLFILTALWLILTICLSFLSSSPNPPLIFTRPEWTVLVLTFLSNGSVFLLGELTVVTNEMLRWTMCARPSGVGIATFLGLSRATSNIGVLSLFFSNQNIQHRKWCFQRYKPSLFY